MATTLEAVRTTPNEDVVASLEELLAKAKAGQIRAFLFCGTMLGGEVVRARSTGEGSVFELLGAWEVTRAMLVKHITED